jgi:glutathionylspermidine synthase
MNMIVAEKSPPVPARQAHPLRAGEALDPDAFFEIRRKLILDCCKWDPQVEDVSSVASFPVLIGRRCWRELCKLAEALSTELFAAERELIFRPELHRVLGVPWKVRQLFRDIDGFDMAPPIVRSLRFDFHWTLDGWRISEVNSDVPGGFAEGSMLSRLMCADACGSVVPDDPGARWADAMEDVVGEGHVALLAAPGFMEDQQVVSYLAKQLNERGFRTHLARPEQLGWDDDRAKLACAWYEGSLSAIVRFYQAEWLANLSRPCPWQKLFVGSRTPVTNPGVAVLTESKRFPLVWDELSCSLPTWRRLLPESRDPRDAPWQRDGGWLLKTPYCNTGDTVTARDLCTPLQWMATLFSVRLRPHQWVAQRRFEPTPIESPLGPVYPCVGVYTINGRSAGAYTRISSRTVVDYRAVDAALLIEESTT